MSHLASKKSAYNRFARYRNWANLSAEVAAYPTSWRLVPVEEKSPRIPSWQEARYNRDQILDFLENGYLLKSKKTGLNYRAFPSGVGLLTGDASGGLLLVDFDGPSAMKLWTAMGGDEAIASLTRTHSSGKEGRMQIWLQVPESHRDALREFTRHVVTEWNETKSDSGELLEFRYNRCQSVLPPSLHPKTKEYKWINEKGILACPNWLLEILVSWAAGEKQQSIEKERLRLENEQIRQARLEAWRMKQEGKESGSSSEETTLAELLEFEILPRLSPEQIYNHPSHDWRYVGNRMEGAPVWRESSSGRSLHVNLSDCTWYDFGLECGGGPVQYRWAINFGGVPGSTPKGADFVAVVRELANDAGVEVPKFSLRTVRGTIVKQSRTKIIERFAIAAKDFIQKLGRDLSLLTKECRRYLREFGELPERVGLNSEGRKAWWNFGKQLALVPLSLSPQATQRTLETFFETERRRVIEYVPGQLDLSQRLDDMEIVIGKNQITQVVEESFAKCGRGDVFLLQGGAGIGKTHQIGEINPNNISKTARVWYLDGQYRNPNTSTVEAAATEVPVKHGGITIDPYRKTEAGNQYRRRTLPGEPTEAWDHKANCIYSGTFDAARDKGVYIRGGESSPNCENCSKFKNASGKIGCSALLGRLEVINNSKERFLSSHPNSVSVGESSYLIYEEADKNLDPFKRVAIPPADIAALIADLRVKGGDELAIALQPIADLLYQLSIDAPKYGFLAKEVISKIDVAALERDLQKRLNTESPQTLEITAGLLEKILQPDFYSLFKGLPNPTQRAEAVEKQVRFNWLSPLLRMLTRESLGSFQLDKLGLHLTLFDWRSHRAVKKAAGTLAMSATLDKTNLARKLKVPASRIITIRIKTGDLPVYQNLTIKNIRGANFGKQRRDENEFTAGQRAVAFANWLIKNHSNPCLLDHKVNINNYEGLKSLVLGYYGHDSRGSNRFQHCDALALMGEFWPNIGAKLAEFETLIGEFVETDDPRFCAWLRSQMVAEMLGQAVGRLRSHRRSEELTCYLIGDSYGLNEISRYYPGAKIETLEMAQVCREAAPKKEQKMAQLTEIISQSVASGNKPGRNSVAKQLQWSAGQVSKLANYLGEKIGISAGWGELIEAVTSVLKGLNTKVTGHRNLTPVELRTVEVFFPSLLDDLRRDAISTEAAAREIYLALRQFGPELERVLGELGERSLWEVVNLFGHLASKADLTVEELGVLRECGLA
jgi:hypothetical protein